MSMYKILNKTLELTYSNFGTSIINDALLISDITKIKNADKLETIFEVYYLLSLLSESEATIIQTWEKHNG